MSWPFFVFHPVDCRCVEQLPAVPGTYLFDGEKLHSLKPRQQFPFTALQVTDGQYK